MLAMLAMVFVVDRARDFQEADDGELEEDVSLTLSRIEEIGAYDQDLSAIIWGGCGHYARQGGASPILLGTRGSLHLSVSACAALNRSAIGRCPCASSKCSWPEFALPHQRQPPKRAPQFSRALRESSFWKALGQRARLHKSEPGLPCSRPMRTQASVLHMMYQEPAYSNVRPNQVARTGHLHSAAARRRGGGAQEVALASWADRLRSNQPGREIKGTFSSRKKLEPPIQRQSPMHEECVYASDLGSSRISQLSFPSVTKSSKRLFIIKATQGATGEIFGA
jgi:hypothetical protein